MSAKVFMLSYTVARKVKSSTREDDHSKAIADRVRDQILNIKNGWESHPDIETTLTGVMDVDGFLNKAAMAKSLITNEIKPFLSDIAADYKPSISLLLVVNGLNEVVSFKL